MKVEKHECDYCGGPAGGRVPHGVVTRNVIPEDDRYNLLYAPDYKHICNECMEAKEL